MKLSHIVTCAKNQVIGKGNEKLPWDLPEDLQLFKDITENRIIIMGRIAFESLKEPLPNRKYIVITFSKDFHKKASPDVHTVDSLEAALEKAKELAQTPEEEIFVAGGEQVYRQTLELTKKVYLTLVNKEHDGDRFYPVELITENPELFEKIQSQHSKNSEPHFESLVYKRIKAHDIKAS